MRTILCIEAVLIAVAGLTTIVATAPARAQATQETAYTQFLGEWEGHWNTQTSGMVSSTLTITAINLEKKTASIKYTQGRLSAYPWPLEINTEGTFSDERTLTFSSGATTYTFTLQGEVLKGYRNLNNFTGYFRKKGN